MSGCALVTLKPVFLNAGHCWQSQYFTGAGGVGLRKFHAVMVHFEHPVHGECLVDCGYGPDYWWATRGLPERLLRWVTPLSRRQAVFGDGFLASIGIDPGKIAKVFVSHFHADHIGGLRLFPSARIVYRQSAFDWLKGLSRWQQVHQGFLAGLLPDDFGSRGDAVQDELFTDRRELGGLRSFDFWGDGSLWLVDLPGHAVGQTGFVMSTAEGHLGYAVDAFWDGEAWEEGRRLPWLARRIQHSWIEYETTQDKMRRCRSETGINWLGTHCPRTQTAVTGKVVRE